VLDAVAGHDPADPDSSRRPAVDHLDALRRPADGLRVGVQRRHLDAGADLDAVAAFEEAVSVLARCGCVLTEAVVPLYEEMQAATMVVNSAESFAYHPQRPARPLGGVRAVRSHAARRWCAAVRRRRRPGDRVRRAGVRRLHDLFARVDVVVSPTTTRPAPSYESVFQVGLMGLFDRIHTAYWNGAGTPVVALPIGFTGDGLPLSMQIAAPPFADAVALRVAHAYQQATAWHREAPPLEVDQQRPGGSA